MFHEGEIAVQMKAGVATQAARVGGIIRREIVPAAARFLEERSFAVVGAMRGEAMWAGLVVGRLRSVDDGRVLEIDGSGDDFSGPVGVLAIDPATRRRMRVNGRAERTSTGWRIAVEESYGNCPQHITRRSVDQAALALAARREVARGRALTPEQAAWVASADTWFVATRHPTRGADVSHRGGTLRVDSDRELSWDDYDGNMMFNTLGNLEVDDRAGLLLVDWDAGRVLQLSGRARVDWRPGGRTMRFAIEQAAYASI